MWFPEFLHTTCVILFSTDTLFGILVTLLTTVMPSFSNDSPNTRIKSTSSTCISSNTASTATGSTAQISEEKSSMCSTGICILKMPVRPMAYKLMPAQKIRFE